MTGLNVFNTTVHKTNGWLRDLMEELGTENRLTAYRVRDYPPTGHVGIGAA